MVMAREGVLRSSEMEREMVGWGVYEERGSGGFWQEACRSMTKARFTTRRLRRSMIQEASTL